MMTMHTLYDKTQGLQTYVEKLLKNFEILEVCSNCKKSSLKIIGYKATVQTGIPDVRGWDTQYKEEKKMKKIEMSMKFLKEELLLDNEQIKQLLQLPPEDQKEFLIERKMRVDVMRALIESGADPEKAKKVLTDPTIVEIVEEDEAGNQKRHLYQ